MSIEVPRPVLKGSKALVAGIANDHSIAYAEGRSAGRPQQLFGRRLREGDGDAVRSRAVLDKGRGKAWQ